MTQSWYEWLKAEASKLFHNKGYAYEHKAFIKGGQAIVHELVEELLHEEDTIEDLREKLKQKNNIQTVRLQVFINHLKIEGTNMKYQVHRSDFPIKVKLKPTDDAGDSEPIQKGSAAYSTDVDGVVKVTEDATDEETAVIDFVAAGKVQILTKAKSEDGTKDLSTSDEFEVLEDEATKATAEFTDKNGAVLSPLADAVPA